MRWSLGVVGAVTFLCFVPVEASALSCGSACQNDAVVEEAAPAGAGGVLLYSWDSIHRRDVFPYWEVKVEKAQDDGTFVVVSHDTEFVEDMGTMVFPETFDVGDVFRVETTVSVDSFVCESWPGPTVVHEFEVRETPAVGTPVELEVFPAEVLVEQVPYYEEYLYGPADETFTGRTSRVDVAVTVPDVMRGVAGALRIEFHAYGNVYYGDIIGGGCSGPVWRTRRVGYEGRYTTSFKGLCSALDTDFSGPRYTQSALRDAPDDGVLSARVFVPGTELEWWSEEVPLAFACPEPGSLPWDVDDVDDGESGDADAGGVPGDGGDEGVEEPSGEGGGCAQGGGRTPAPLGWLGLSVALGWFVRRRRLG